MEKKIKQVKYWNSESCDPVMELIYDDGKKEYINYCSKQCLFFYGGLISKKEFDAILDKRLFMEKKVKQIRYWNKEWDKPIMELIYEDDKKEYIEYFDGEPAPYLKGYPYDSELISKEQFDALVKYRKYKHEYNKIDEKVWREKKELTAEESQRMKELKAKMEEVYEDIDWSVYQIPGEPLTREIFRKQIPKYINLNGIPLYADIGRVGLIIEAYDKIQPRSIKYGEKEYDQINNEGKIITKKEFDKLVKKWKEKNKKDN